MKPMSPDRRELIAMVVSAGLILGSLLYWVAQILGVIDTLKIAYG